jgi:mono/diheme cytochrome c family protein
LASVHNKELRRGACAAGRVIIHKAISAVQCPLKVTYHGGKTAKPFWGGVLVICNRAWILLVLSVVLGAPAARAQRDAPPEPMLSAEELQGKKLFMQRCSVCHLPPLYRPPELKPYGPLLNGYLRNPQFEARARKAINDGTPRMPGFQYGLSKDEIDDVIAYLKTLKPASVKSEGGSNANTGRTGD